MKSPLYSVLFQSPCFVKVFFFCRTDLCIAVNTAYNFCGMNTCRYICRSVIYKHDYCVIGGGRGGRNREQLLLYFINTSCNFRFKIRNDFFHIVLSVWCSFHCIISVSYTHLDVYKRQVYFNMENIFRSKTQF